MDSLVSKQRNWGTPGCPKGHMHCKVTGMLQTAVTVQIKGWIFSYFSLGFWNGFMKIQPDYSLFGLGTNLSDCQLYGVGAQLGAHARINWFSPRTLKIADSDEEYLIKLRQNLESRNIQTIEQLGHGSKAVGYDFGVQEPDLEPFLAYSEERSY